MPKFGRKKGLSDYLYSKPVIFILFVIITLMSFSVFERYQVAKEMSARRLAAEEEYKELEKRKQDLQEKVDYLGGERGIEEEVRKHFDVAKKGEKVIILLGEDEESEAEIDTEVERKKWYQFWR